MPSQEREVKFTDFNPEHGLQITVREDGKVVWVSVDGITVLRASNVPTLELNLPDETFLTYGESDEEDA